MKKPLIALVVLLFAASFGGYSQEKKPAAKTQPVIDSPQEIEIKDVWGDISIDAPVSPMAPEQGDDYIYSAAEVQVAPEFPGGITALLEYINKNINKDALTEDTPDGKYKVFASFIIEKDGTLTDIKILRDPGYGMGRESLNTLKAIKKKWSPGIVNGKPVRVRYTLPIIITLP